LAHETIEAIAAGGEARITQWRENAMAGIERVTADFLKPGPTAGRCASTRRRS
jgi:hypothetical protein